MPKYVDADAFDKYVHSDWDIVDFVDVMKALREFPAADARENVHGKWVKLTGMMPPELFGRHLCSECDGFALHDWKHHKEQLTDFCPNCGAEMKEASENEQK